MTVYPRHMYRDPLEILIEREGKTCKGCRHLSVVVILGDRREMCAKGKKTAKKCPLYKESE